MFSFTFLTLAPLIFLHFQYFSYFAAEVAIVDPPLSQQITEGETINLLCGTTGSPKPNVMWNRNDAPLPNTNRFVIGQNNDLTIRGKFIHLFIRNYCTNEISKV